MSNTNNIMTEIPVILKNAIERFQLHHNYESTNQLLINCLAYEAYTVGVYHEFCLTEKIPHKITKNVHLDSFWPELDTTGQYIPYITIKSKNMRDFYRMGRETLTFKLPQDLHTHVKETAAKENISMSKYIAVTLLGQVATYPTYVDLRSHYFKDYNFCKRAYARDNGYLMTDEYFQDLCQRAEGRGFKQPLETVNA